MTAPVDVLSVLRELRETHVRANGAVMSDHDGSLARIDAAVAAVADSHAANVLFIEAIDYLCGITAGWPDDRIYDELPSSGVALAYFAARAAIAKAVQP